MSNSERLQPPWSLKYVNKAMIGLSRLGVTFGPVVLTVPGRKSGKPRSTPVTPMTVDGREYIVGGLPGSDWAANARAAGEGTLQRGRRIGTNIRSRRDAGRIRRIAGRGVGILGHRREARY